MTLLVAVVIVVVGALSGTWMSIMGMFGGNGFYLGHQGYEYIELGRNMAIAFDRRNDHLAGPCISRDHPRH